jgi:hypothetical protein
MQQGTVASSGVRDGTARTMQNPWRLWTLLTITVVWGITASGYDADPSDSFPSNRRIPGASETARLIGAKKFLSNVTGENGAVGATGKGRNTVAKFTCYVARCSGGDWDSNLGSVADGRWRDSCVERLLIEINRWSKGHVQGTLQPEALDLASREWIEKIKPPFIFLTGHQDLDLSEAEVQALREYIMIGGFVWVENSQPGRDERFEKALRREFGRVLPDREWHPVLADQPIFNSYFEFSGLPAGFNSRKEPLQFLRVGAGKGDMAVLYSPNGYSQLWKTELTEKESGSAVGSSAVADSYRLGMNIVIHLLTRYQDKIRKLPKADWSPIDGPP